ncbi:MAG TPA: hypothetical protein VFZ58_05530 [Candidatus Saccharimonadales bacterium]
MNTLQYRDNLSRELIEEFRPSHQFAQLEPSPPLGRLTFKPDAIATKEYPDYAAEGGTVTVIEDGCSRATMSFIAYSKPAANSRRPVTLVMNGGPLSPGTLWNHNELFSPRILRHELNGHLKPGSVPEANPHTLLQESDMVFLDPIGTGYGQPLSESDVARFFGVENDAAVALAFLEAYLHSHNRDDASIILAGSSYATLRMTAIANMLQQKNRDAAALLLVSGNYDHSLTAHDAENPENNRLASITNLPSFAVAAMHHNAAARRRRPADYYNEVAEFAWGPYAQALKTKKYPRNLIEKIASLTGLDTKLIQANQLQVPLSVFQKQLLGRQGLMLSGVDSRLAFKATQPVTVDPALDNWEPHYKKTTNDTFARIGYSTENTDYNGILMVYPQWPFTNDWQERTAAVTMRTLLQNSPHLRIAEVSGLYDLIGNRQKREVFWQQLLPECKPWQQKNMPAVNTVPAPRVISTYEIAAGHQPGVDPTSQDFVGKLACRLAAAVAQM